MSARQHRLELLTTEEVASIDKERATVVLPIGAVEQHGAHLPCATDVIVADLLTDLAIARLAPGHDVWRLPALAFGRSVEHIGYAGTVALRTETLLAVCNDVADSLAASGFRRLVFLNGHGGQPQLLEVVARDIRLRTGLLVFPILSYRLGVPEGVISSSHEFEHGIHGGELETSLLLSLAPDLVHTDRLEPGGAAASELFAACDHLSLEGALPTAWLTEDLSANGTIGDPRAAGVEKGHRIVEHWVEGLAGVLREIGAFAFPERTSPGSY